MHSAAALLSTVGLLTSTTLALPSTSSARSAKGGFSVPARRVKHFEKRDDNSVSATEHVVVDFTFGGQPIPVAIDSGSTFTYVASTLITNTSETSGLPALYNPNSSSTFHEENDPNDAYNCGGDPTNCFMGLDDVSTAGLTASQMAFGVTTSLGEGVFASGQAATMGFGRQAGDPSTWLPRDQAFYYRAGADLPSPYLFAVDLYGDRNGTFDFGFIDDSKYTGDISYSDVDTTQTNWNFQMTGYAIGDGDIQSVTQFAGVVDSGGPNMGLPAEIVNAYYGSIGGSPSPGNSHTYPCSAYPPPDLTLQLASGDKLVLNGTFLVTPPDGSGAETCNGRIDDSEQTAYNIGACVIDQKYIVYDIANSKIGFAAKASLGGSKPAHTSSSAKESASATQSEDPASSRTTQSAASTAMATETDTAESAAGGRMEMEGRSYIWVSSWILSIFILIS